MRQIAALLILGAIGVGGWIFWPQIKGVIGQGGQENQAANNDGKTTPATSTDPTGKQDLPPKNDPKKEKEPGDTPQGPIFTPKLSLTLVLIAPKGHRFEAESNLPPGTKVYYADAGNGANPETAGDVATPIVVQQGGKFQWSFAAGALMVGQPIVRISAYPNLQTPEINKRFGKQGALLGGQFAVKNVQALLASPEPVTAIRAFATLDIKKIKKARVKRGVRKISLRLTPVPEDPTE